METVGVVAEAVGLAAPAVFAAVEEEDNRRSSFGRASSMMDLRQERRTKRRQEEQERPEQKELGNCNHPFRVLQTTMTRMTRLLMNPSLHANIAPEIQQQQQQQQK